MMPKTAVSLLLWLAAVGLAPHAPALRGDQTPAAASERTTITAWPHDRRGAVSITFDDASINQFRVAAPLLDDRKMPGTFFVITSGVAGSRYEARFVGRPPQDILRESATVPTGAGNYLERTSAAPFLGFSGLIGLRTSAARPNQQTFTRVDEAYARARSGALPPLPPGSRIYMNNDGDIVQEPVRPDVQFISWPELKQLADRGHEIGSHTVMHPRLDALDDANLRDELMRSREELLAHLGQKHTFSAECPFGIEDERAVRHALEIYPATRNRMPETWLEEHNRSSRLDPTTSQKPYVQWQRGLLDDTPLDTARGWIDTTAADSKIWLVLVIHGVEGIGWEAIPRQTLVPFFDHLADARDRVWVATFQDVVKYMRERMSATVRTAAAAGSVQVTLTHTLDAALYDLPLTLKTYLPAAWTAVQMTQGQRAAVSLDTHHDQGGSYVLYEAVPNAGPVALRSSRR